MPALSVGPDATLLDALTCMVRAGVDQVDVVAGDRVVGRLSRDDVLHARLRAAEAEQRQTGWIARVSRSRGPTGCTAS